jgi:hypothetical protein
LEPKYPSIREFGRARFNTGPIERELKAAQPVIFSGERPRTAMALPASQGKTGNTRFSACPKFGLAAQTPGLRLPPVENSAEGDAVSLKSSITVLA